MDGEPPARAAVSVGGREERGLGFVGVLKMEWEGGMAEEGFAKGWSETRVVFEALEDARWFVESGITLAGLEAVLDLL